ncbi:type VII secretion-associated protein [Mycolicibacterium sp. J2]|uniref:type VII secretion-associated protein n=1 Tax=Mycolicibacterium sp. J2 TaxID=2993511 RepID=UPI00224B234A|nr:type VII secretion-associated protein [Mycolicibacterium sp. J2]MCX2712036.1 type VII secretion-associated protein [Mycolicibacterium sp. J2]
MTSTPVVFGPATVRGPCPVPAELVRAGLAAVDDQHTVVDDRMVEVDTVLGEIVRTAVGDACREIVLICPGWWPGTRLDRVRAAAAGQCSEVVVLQRPQVYRRAHPDVEVFVEFADEFVMAGALTDEPPAAALVVPRQADPADAVVSGLGEPTSVLIDVPTSVTGARAVATDIAARLRRGGMDVVVVGDRHLCRAAAGPADVTSTVDVRHRALPWIVTAGLLAVSVSTWALLGEPDRDTTVSVVEGRVVASVPAGWTVERVTAGTGSRRLQAVEPGSDRAVLIVQSRAEADLTATAATLDTALRRQDPDVFTTLRSPAERGGRTVIGYTETRAGREIDWAVFLDGTVRIAVGCQSPPGQAAQLRAACDAVIRSAHAIS